MLTSWSGQTQKHIQEVSKRESFPRVERDCMCDGKNDLSRNTLVFIGLQMSVLARQ